MKAATWGVVARFGLNLGRDRSTADQALGLKNTAILRAGVFNGPRIGLLYSNKEIDSLSQDLFRFVSFRRLA